MTQAGGETVAVRIRLKRMGAKKRPFYRLIVADSRAARDGRFIDQLGYYDPIADPIKLEVNEEKALQWLSNGAQPSDTARDLLRKAGVWDKFRTGKKSGAAADLETAKGEDASETTSDGHVPSEAGEA